MSGAPEHRGFSLIEVLIVVVILGVLAAIVLPQYASASASAERTAFVQELRVWRDAADRLRAETGDWPCDETSGTLPAELGAYASVEAFGAATPVGGAWDFECNSLGVAAAVGVHFQDGSLPGEESMRRIDLMLDDGDLATGVFRRLAAGRYYVVLQP